MRILIAGADSKTRDTLVAELSRGHDVQVLGIPGGDTGGVFDPKLVERAAAGCDAVIYLPLCAQSNASPLEILDLATRGTYNLLNAAPPSSRFILATSLRPFESYPPEYRVNEMWRPCPSTEVEDLAPYLAEITARELSYELPLKVLCLRLAEVVDGPTGEERDPRLVHIDDVVQAFERALAFEPPADEPKTGWWVFHILGAGSRTRFPLALAATDLFGYRPRHDLTGALMPTRSGNPHKPRRFTGRSGGTARRVVIFGAASRLGAVAATALESDHLLRLTDVRSLEEAALVPPQRPDHPRVKVLGSPHENRVVDIRNADQVAAAAQGMEAIVNCTVVRHDLAGAFHVNALGCYNVMKAAVQHGIRRVVHTGPLLTALQKEYLHQRVGFWHDYCIVDDTPPR